MFTIFNAKPEPKPEPETPRAEYQIQVNGYGKYFIHYWSPLMGGIYRPWLDSKSFDSWEDAEKCLFEYLEHRRKLHRRVVCEIFVEKDKS